MPRAKREQSPINSYHVLLRGEQPLFPSNTDKAVFLELCKKYFIGDIKLYALAVLSDRIHLVFEENGGGASSIIKPLTTSYARYYNRTYSRSGKLFTDRYKSVAISDKQQLTDCVVYVDLMYGESDICSKTEFFNNICASDEYRRLMDNGVKNVCIDAFDLFTNDDILSMMCRITGEDISAVNSMNIIQKREFLKKAASASAYKWVSKSKMASALGVTIQSSPSSSTAGTAAPKKKTTPKAAAASDGKKENQASSTKTANTENTSKAVGKTPSASADAAQKKTEKPTKTATEPEKAVEEKVEKATSKESEKEISPSQQRKNSLPSWLL